MRQLEEHVVVGKVGQLSHFFGQLIGNLVQRLHHKTALAGVQAHEIIVELPEEILVVIPLAWNLALAFPSCLVGERNSAEETIGEVFPIKRACGIGS